MPAPRSATRTDTASAPSSPTSIVISLDDAGVRQLDRFHGVAQEVEDHLLEMDLVDDHHRQRAGRLQLDADVAELAVRLHHVHAFPDRTRDVDLLRLELVPLHHAAHARHHVARPRRLADDLVHQVRHPREIGRVFPHATARRQRVVLDRPQRLGDLVGKRCRHLPRRMHPHQVRQALAPLCCFDLRGQLPALGRLARVQAREHFGQQPHPWKEALGPRAFLVRARKEERSGDRVGDGEWHGEQRTHAKLADLWQVVGRLRGQVCVPAETDHRAADEPGAEPRVIQEGGQQRRTRGAPEVRSAELAALWNPLPQTRPLHPEEEADVLEPPFDRAGLVAGAGEEQRCEDGGRQALEADRLLQLVLCALAGEGVAEDLRQEPHPLEQLLRPRALAPDATEAEAAVELSGDDHRHRHVGFQPDTLVACPIEACFRGQVVEPREDDRSILVQHRPSPRPGFPRRSHLGGALHPGTA